jgi:hypothetical protein
MPLMHSKSDKAFTHNIKAEMHAGKPQNQSLAIAYAVKRRAKKAYGGDIEETEIPIIEDVKVEKPIVEDVKVEPAPKRIVEDVKVEENPIKGHSDRDVYPHEYAEGGRVERIMHARSCGCDDPHCSYFSEGGRVANHMESSDAVDESMEGGFDDLARRDDLEFSYTGANSGDELGNDQEDEDRKDIVARIMRSRAKKDRNPRPA